jgi:hypothetical protein
MLIDLQIPAGEFCGDCPLLAVFKEDNDWHYGCPHSLKPLPSVVTLDYKRKAKKCPTCPSVEVTL